METQNVELCIDGFRYFYRVYPNPESNFAPFVLISGSFQSIDTWKKHAKWLNQFAPVIVFDAPGVGLSDPLPAHYGLDFLANSLLKVLEMEGVSLVNLLGVSYGTVVAYSFARLYPHKVNRMILSGIMAEMPTDQAENIQKSIALLQAGKKGDFVDSVLQFLICQDEQKPVAKRRSVERVLKSTVSTASTDDLEKYRQNMLRTIMVSRLDLTDSPDVPTLVFTGEHDTCTAPRHCLKFAAALSKGIYTTIQKADHLCHIEQFLTVVGLAADFFLELPLEALEGCTPVEYFDKHLPIEIAA